MVRRLKVVCIFLLMFTSLFLLVSCNTPQLSGAAQKSEKIEPTPQEKRKAKLLKKLDSKYEDAKAHFELGRLYQEDGLLAQAENEYSITLSFDPAHRKAQAARVKTLIDIGDKSKAEILSDEYMNQVSGSALGSLKLALGFQRHGLDEKALSCYQQALRLAPNSARVNRQIGYYYLSKSDKIQAQNYLSRSFQLDPMQSEVAGELGRLGVSIRVPKKTNISAKKLDKAIDKAEKSN